MATAGMYYGYGLGVPLHHPKPMWWEILQVSPSASDIVIKASYRALAKSCHPDHGGSSEAMERLNEAYGQALKSHGAKNS